MVCLSCIALRVRWMTAADVRDTAAFLDSRGSLPLHRRPSTLPMRINAESHTLPSFPSYFDTSSHSSSPLFILFFLPSLYPFNNIIFSLSSFHTFYLPLFLTSVPPFLFTSRPWRNPGQGNRERERQGQGREYAALRGQPAIRQYDHQHH